MSNRLLKLSLTCSQCKKVTTLEVDSKAYKAWQSGTLIQRAFPSLSADERELMISGICGSCFDSMFPDEEEA